MEEAELATLRQMTLNLSVNFQWEVGGRGQNSLEKVTIGFYNNILNILTIREMGKKTHNLFLILSVKRFRSSLVIKHAVECT